MTNQFVRRRVVRVLGAVVVGLFVLPLVGGCGEEEAEDGNGTAAHGEAPIPANRLGGLYFRMVSSFNGQYITFSQEHYYFSPDGRVFDGVPTGGLEQVDLDAIAAQRPGRVGTYTIGGDKLRIVWGGDRKPSEMKFARKDGDNVELDEIFTTKVDRFAPGTRLDGTYSWAGVAGGGTGAVVSAGRSFTFTTDGKFTDSRSAGASITAGGDTHAATDESQSGGAYELSGNTLTLTYADGRVVKRTAYPFVNVDNEIEINVDGTMMSKS